MTKTTSAGRSAVVEYSIKLDGDNANLDGKYTFGVGHDLAGYTLKYDMIKWLKSTVTFLKKIGKLKATDSVYKVRK